MKLVIEYDLNENTHNMDTIGELLVSLGEDFMGTRDREGNTIDLRTPEDGKLFLMEGAFAKAQSTFSEEEVDLRVRVTYDVFDRQRKLFDGVSTEGRFTASEGT